MSTERPCPGSGKQPRSSFTGEMLKDGRRLYRSACAWCDKPFVLGSAMPLHTFHAIGPQGVSFTYGGGCLEGIEDWRPIT